MNGGINLPSYFAHYDVLFSCPSDMEDEKQIVELALHYINETIAKINNICFDIKYWKSDVLFSNGNAQEVINENIVYSSDLIIAIFGTKLGTPTNNYDSGTIEEIAKMIEMGKQVFVCFSEKDVLIPHDASEEILVSISKVRKFKKDYDGLYISFKTDEELKMKLQNQLLLYCRKLISDGIIEKFSCGIPFTLQEKRNAVIQSVSTAKEIIFCARTGKIFLMAHYNHLMELVRTGGHFTFLTSYDFNIEGDSSEFRRNQDLSLQFVRALYDVSPKNVSIRLVSVPINNTILYLQSDNEEFIDFKFNFQSAGIEGRPMFRVYKGNPFFKIFYSEINGLINMSTIY